MGFLGSSGSPGPRALQLQLLLPGRAVVQHTLSDGSKAVMAVIYLSGESCQRPLWSRPLGAIPVHTTVSSVAVRGLLRSSVAKAARVLHRAGHGECGGIHLVAGTNSPCPFLLQLSLDASAI